MDSNEIRKLFLDFFRARGHSVENPASLVPLNDPSLLFTGAGMNQFKDLFFGKGESRLKRAATCQRCFRATDIDNVGRTSRHLTFLEMLGNFSFGDYFKEEAVAMAWEFLSEKLQIPEESMLVTVFQDDEESFRLWNEKMDIPSERIFRMGPEDNFWEMGRTGPCGPCSEIIIDRGMEHGCGSASCGPACECDRHMELWNLVFTQFNRTEDGSLEPLSQKNIDTGMGLERAASIVQGAATVFDTDLLKPLVVKAFELTEKENSSDCKIIADHSRSAVFLIADGVIPSKDGRGYVLRRIIRKILEKTPEEKRDCSLFPELVNSVCGLMKNFYPQLESQASEIIHTLEEEREKFSEVFSKIPDLRRRIKELKNEGAETLPGPDYFMFYDTFGIPRETVREESESAGLGVDESAFEQEMEKQRDRSRVASSFKAELPEGMSVSVDPTEFTGYGENETESGVRHIFSESGEQESAGERVECCLITLRSPFYAESGGQQGDAGTIEGEDWIFEVKDTRKENSAIIHCGRVTKGTVRKGDRCTLLVDTVRRANAAANHTATHLLQYALKKTLGSHVRQAGSSVDHEGLRFDFVHPSRLTPGQISEVEDVVNEAVRANHAVTTRNMPLEEALKAGAYSMPGENYGSTVRVVESGPHSAELCGGTHTPRTGDIGVFIITNESSIAAGVRRIEAITGREAMMHIRGERDLLREAASALKSSPGELPERIETLSKANKSLEKQISEMKAGRAAEGIEKIMKSRVDVDGITLVTHAAEGISPEALDSMADRIRRKLGSGVCVLASVNNGRVQIVASATPDAVSRGINAGGIVKETAARLGGGGGGRPDFAKAGGKNPADLPLAMEGIAEILKKQIETGDA